MDTEAMADTPVVPVEGPELVADIQVLVEQVDTHLAELADTHQAVAEELVDSHQVELEVDSPQAELVDIHQVVDLVDILELVELVEEVSDQEDSRVSAQVQDININFVHGELQDKLYYHQHHHLPLWISYSAYSTLIFLPFFHRHYLRDPQVRCPLHVILPSV